MRTILSTVRNILREPSPDVDVHFHQGPGGQPSPCYERACPAPKLHIDWR